MVYQDVGLKVTYISEEDCDYYIIRKLCITDMHVSRDVGACFCGWNYKASSFHSELKGVVYICSMAKLVHFSIKQEKIK